MCLVRLYFFVDSSSWLCAACVLESTAIYHISGDEDVIDMAGMVGKVEEFNSDTEEWSQYEDTVCIYGD